MYIFISSPFVGFQGKKLGNLAVYGVKTLENRKKVIRMLSINRSANFYWAGANDIASEGNWVWINGERASSSELIWINGFPELNSTVNRDCLLIDSRSVSSYFGFAHDNSCTNTFRGICEKKSKYFKQQ